MTWVRVDDAFTQHPKVLAAGPLAIAMQVAGLCYCNRNLTNGFVPWAVARTLVTWEFLEPPDDDGERRICEVGVTSGMAGETVDAEYVIRLMLQSGMWQEIPGGYLIHDYLDFQPSREQVEAEHQAKVAAGQAGGQAAARARAKAGALAKRKQNSSPNPNPKPEARGPVPEPLAAAAASDPVLALLSKNFANELGNLSVGVGDELRDWSERIPANGRGEKCIEYAFREAAAQSHRSWSYVAAILTRLESEGWPAEPETVAPPSKAEADWLERRYQRGKATT